MTREELFILAELAGPYTADYVNGWAYAGAPPAFRQLIRDHYYSRTDYMPGETYEKLWKEYLKWKIEPTNCSPDQT